MALKGSRHDGHAFVARALERGEAAVVVERPCPEAGPLQVGVPDARVLYAGVRDDTESLKHLAMTTRAAANRAGVTVEGRKFTPHVTLARLRRPVDVTRWVRIFDTYSGPVWTAASLQLIESRLGEGPGHSAAYTTVGEWDFLG